jgi:hypothetical protein
VYVGEIVRKVASVESRDGQDEVGELCTGTVLFVGTLQKAPWWERTDICVWQVVDDSTLLPCRGGLGTTLWDRHERARHWCEADTHRSIPFLLLAEASLARLLYHALQKCCTFNPLVQTFVRLHALPSYLTIHRLLLFT